MAKKRQFNEAVVLQQVSQYFWDHGYAATKVDELSVLTGLTKTSLYNAFGNKEALFIKSVDFYLEQQLAPFNQAMDDKVSLSDAISAALNLRFGESNPLMTQGCLLTNSILELKSNDLKLHTYVIERFETVRQAMKSFFAWFVDNKKVNEGIDAEHLTDLYITFLQGLNVHSRNPDAKATMARAISMF